MNICTARFYLATLLVALLLPVADRTAHGAPVQLFYGLDPAAGIGGAHPNSDAARASFLAALDPGTIGVETFEGLPLGPVTGNLAFPPIGTTGSVVDLNSTAVQGAFDGANLLFAVTGSNYLRSVTVGTQSYFELTLSSPQNGVGFFGVGLSDFLGYGGFAPPIQITLDGGDPIDVLNVNPTGIPSTANQFLKMPKNLRSFLGW